MSHLVRIMLAVVALSTLSACVTTQPVEVVSVCEYGYERFAEVPDDEVLARWKRYEFLEKHCFRGEPVVFVP